MSAFLASHGILRYGSITDDMRRRAAAALEPAGVGAPGAPHAGSDVER